MDFATNSLRIEQVTPEKATEYLRCNYIHNRPLRKNHVAYLANEMRCGRFMPTAEIHLMFRNGEPVLVNGQHTCGAIVEYGKPVSVTVRRTITRDPGEIALTYAFGHDTGLRRTFTDAMGAYNLAEATGLGRRQVDYLATALRHIKLGFTVEHSGNNRPLKQSPADLVDDIYAWAPEAKMLFSAIAYCDKSVSRLIQKRGSLSVAILTMHYQPDKALDFWKSVTQPDGLAWTDPRMTARRYLESSKSKASTHGVTPGRLSRQMAGCWNAFYRGESKSRVEVNDELSLLVLLGTPYNGKQPRDFLPSKWGEGIKQLV